MEHPRTAAARAHDDSAIIDAAIQAPASSGSSGGNLQRDVASQLEIDAVDDPEQHRRVKKKDAFEHGNARRRERARGA